VGHGGLQLYIELFTYFRFKGFQTIWALVWLGWWMVAFSYVYISLMKNLPKRNIPTQVKMEEKKGCVH
jgi:hypothetical protein